MRFLLCIDDTDDTTKSVGTGEIATHIMEALQEKGCSFPYNITRHQLLLDPSIDYTSHNSSMCMDGEGNLNADEIWETAVSVLMSMRSPISNPGVCLYTDPEPEGIRRLSKFGKKAKEEVLTVQKALHKASNTPGVRLEAPAGNGNGQIGALAGIGLRLDGNDGTFRGKIRLEEELILSCAEMKAKLGVQEIYDVEGGLLEDDKTVRASRQLKLILRNHRPAAAVRLAGDGIYDLCTKANVFEATVAPLSNGVENCEFFEWDNDRGEQWTEKQGRCENCLHRKLTRKGMKCTHYNRMLPTSAGELRKAEALEPDEAEKTKNKPE